MRIGVPKEIKVHEYRVGLTPGSVRELVAHGHTVVVETGLGAGIGCDDERYRAAGAQVVDTAEEAWRRAELIVKVKEPQPSEVRWLHEGQVLFAYLHLAPDPIQCKLLLDTGASALAYETVTDRHGGLPLLAPMSEVAGRMALQAGAHCLEKTYGGLGMLLGGVPGVPPAKVTILGAGTVGAHAVRMAVGMGANVYVLDQDIHKLRALDAEYGERVTTIFSTRDTIERHVLNADLVIGAVLVVGAQAPKLVGRELVARMRPGSVLVDVAIDQGGCFETSHPTTHAEPTYVLDGVIHYCVANMPGAVPRTSALALNNATLPYLLAIAGRGWVRALAEDPGLLNGLNIHRGRVTHRAVAEALGHDYHPACELLAL